MNLKWKQKSMNNFLYIATDTININQPSGVCKKIISQCNVFSSYGDTFLMNYSGDYYFKNNKIEELDKRIQSSKLRRFQLFKDIMSFVKKQKFNVYIRYPYSDFLFLILLFYLKLKGSKIVIEIPTFPYNKNHNGNLYSVLRLLCDSFFSLFLKFFVGRIVTYSDDKRIFGIETINTINGVDFHIISPAKRIRENTNIINLIAVAHLYACHGYDRIIKGISEFNKENHDIKVNFNIVGVGEELDNLDLLIHEYKVENSVKLLGFQTGSKLDEIYDSSDIAINSLAIHRIGLTTESTLKAKEYCAKGLPIISSYDIDSLSLEYNAKFVYKVPLDDSPINISSIVEFYKNVSSIQNYNEEIRKRSKEICDMKITLNPVVSYFLE